MERVCLTRKNYSTASFFLVGLAERRNGTVGTGRIGDRLSADSNGEVRLRLQSCQNNVGHKYSDSVFVKCVDHNHDVDEQFDKLVEATPLGKYDTAFVVIANPLNSTLSTLDSGSEMSYLRIQAVSELKLGKSISFTTIYGNGVLSLDYKSAVTVEMFHINITVVVDSAVDRSALS